MSKVLTRVTFSNVELFQHLLAGKRLYVTKCKKFFYFMCPRGVMYQSHDGDDQPLMWSHDPDQKWTGFIESEWYENIPAHGIAAWSIDPADDSKALCRVVGYEKGHRRPLVCDDGCRWPAYEVIPLTNEEIQQFLRPGDTQEAPDAS